MKRSFLLLGLLLTGFSVAVAADLRTWSDSTGRFKIKAKFVSIEAGTVTLEREDGSQVEIELKKLSAADRKYVEEAQKAGDDPFKPAAKDPFKPRAKARAAPAAASGPKTVTPDWSEARPISPAPASSEWKLAIGAPAAAKIKARAVPLPPKANFFEGTKGLVLNAAARRAVVGYSLDEPKPAGVTRLALCDLEAGKFLGTAAAPGKLAPLALHDDGTRVLMRRDEFGFGNADRLELWSMGESGIKRLVRWSPYDDLRGGDRDVKWAAFLGANRLATVSGSGKLAVWDLDEVKPLYSLGVQGGCIPGVSPDGKLIAFSTGKELGVLDVEGGEVVALQTSPNVQWPILSFSPSGKKIACVAFDKLFVWDAAGGSLEREVPLMGLHVGGLAAWADEEHMLVGGSTLIDLKNQIRLWAYQGAEQVGSLGGYCWFVVSQGTDRPGGLVPAKLPQPGVQQFLARAMSDPNFFVLKPGTTVRIDTSGIADPGQRGKIEAALAAKLQANGCQAGPTGSIDLVASTEVGKTRDVSYRMFGLGFGVRTYKIQEHIARLRFLYQGKPAWETSAVNIPFFVHLKEGETMESYLRQHERPNFAFFENVELPKLLTRPTGSPTLGVSQVTVSGVR